MHGSNLNTINCPRMDGIEMLAWRSFQSKCFNNFIGVSRKRRINVFGKYGNYESIVYGWKKRICHRKHCGIKLKYKLFDITFFSFSILLMLLSCENQPSMKMILSQSAKKTLYTFSCKAVSRVELLWYATQ